MFNAIIKAKKEENNTSIHKESLNFQKDAPNIEKEKKQIVVTRHANGGIKNIQVMPVPGSLTSSQMNQNSEILENKAGARPTLISDDNIREAGKMFAKTDQIVRAEVSQNEEMTSNPNFQNDIITKSKKQDFRIN